jgi:hypothetical protein
MFCMFLDSGRKIEARVGLAVRINPQFAIWRDLFFTTGQTVFFSQSLDHEKNIKQKFVTWNTGIRWASAAMALPSACGPSVPVLLEGACLQSHGRRPLPPAP